MEAKQLVERPPQPGQVKGSLLLARIKYLAAQGPQPQARVLHHLAAADRAVVSGTVLPGAWYPSALLLRLEMTIAALLARGDRRRLFVDMGRYTADVNLAPGGVHHAYLKAGDPLSLLRQVPRIYAAQHTDGHRSCEVLGPNTVVIRSVGVADVDEDDCLTAVGWLERAITLSGARTARVEERQCAARGAPHCAYSCQWS